jgi:hypothetical protein
MNIIICFKRIFKNQNPRNQKIHTKLHKKRFYHVQYINSNSELYFTKFTKKLHFKFVQKHGSLVTL